MNRSSTNTTSQPDWTAYMLGQQMADSAAVMETLGALTYVVNASGHNEPRDTRGELLAANLAYGQELLKLTGVQMLEKTKYVLDAFARHQAFNEDLLVVGSTAIDMYRLCFGLTLANIPSHTKDIDLVVRRSTSGRLLEIPGVLGDSFEIRVGVGGAGDIQSYLVVAKDDPTFRVDFLAYAPIEVGERLAVDTRLVANIPWAKYLSGDPVSCISPFDGVNRISVANPGRMALHKIVLSTERPAGSAKAEKDLLQGIGLVRELPAAHLRLKRAWEALDKKYQDVVGQVVTKEFSALIPLFSEQGINLGGMPPKPSKARDDDENER